MRSHRLGGVVSAKGLPLAIGMAGIAAGVVLGWLVFGTSLAEGFEPDPGIPPPEYLYLDNARVLAFLAQIEGGLSASERRTRSVTRRVDAGISGGGGEAGGSSEEQQFVEQVVTPNATTRFYRLLERLKDKGYLTELDAASHSLARDLLQVQEGAFVRIAGCRLELPSYLLLYRLYEQPEGSFSSFSFRVDDLTPTEKDLFSQISREHQPAFLLRKLLQYMTLEQTRAKQRVDLRVPKKRQNARDSHVSFTLTRSSWDPHRYVRMIGSNPRVPLSSCAPRLSSKPPLVDFLFPIQYAVLSDEQSLLSGTLSIVGKVIRIARVGDRDQYQDSEALRTFLPATVEAQNNGGLLAAATVGSDGLPTELVEDATVFAPGAVIIPIAIYK
jgi:hypothetical protein